MLDMLRSNVTRLADTTRLILGPTNTYTLTMFITRRLRRCCPVGAALQILSGKVKVGMAVIGGGKCSLRTGNLQL